jgi:hypothetical protein
VTRFFVSTPMLSIGAVHFVTDAAVRFAQLSYVKLSPQQFPPVVDCVCARFYRYEHSAQLWTMPVCGTRIKLVFEMKLTSC